MMSMDSRVCICSTMTITIAADVHRQTSVRLCDFVVILSETFRERLSAVCVVLGLAVACVSFSSELRYSR